MSKPKLGLFYAAIALAIVVGGCMSAWDCEVRGVGYTCSRVIIEP